MERNEIPQGFAIALGQNENAVNAYAMMTKEQKRDVLQRARTALSRREMAQLIDEIGESASFSG